MPGYQAQRYCGKVCVAGYITEELANQLAETQRRLGIKSVSKTIVRTIEEFIENHASDEEFFEEVA